MYEPEKILVQNAGIDPGVAALLQNANTGNKYLIYYDKRTGVFQTINHIVAPAA